VYKTFTSTNGLPEIYLLHLQDNECRPNPLDIDCGVGGFDILPSILAIADNLYAILSSTQNRIGM
jgi:hypothetical protein